MEVTELCWVGAAIAAVLGRLRTTAVRVEWAELNKPFLAQGAFTGGFVAHPATRKIT